MENVQKSARVRSSRDVIDPEGRKGEKLETDEGSLASVWSATHKESGDLCVVAYFYKTRIDIIAHESVHVTNSIFQDTHIDFNYENDEHYAYMVGWVAKCIEEAFDLKLTKRKKTK